MIFNRDWTEEHRVVERFAQAMKEELDSNLLKGDREQWSQVSIAELMEEIDHHKEKLVKAFEILDFVKIREHTADIANIVLMIADNSGVLGNDSPRFMVREKQRQEELDQVEQQKREKIERDGIYRGREGYSYS